MLMAWDLPTDASKQHQPPAQQRDADISAVVARRKLRSNPSTMTRTDLKGPERRLLGALDLENDARGCSEQQH